MKKDKNPAADCIQLIRLDQATRIPAAASAKVPLSVTKEKRGDKKTKENKPRVKRPKRAGSGESDLFPETLPPQATSPQSPAPDEQPHTRILAAGGVRVMEIQIKHLEFDHRLPSPSQHYLHSTPEHQEKLRGQRPLQAVRHKESWVIISDPALTAAHLQGRAPEEKVLVSIVDNSCEHPIAILKEEQFLGELSALPRDWEAKMLRTSSVAMDLVYGQKISAPDRSPHNKSNPSKSGKDQRASGKKTVANKQQPVASRFNILVNGLRTERHIRGRLNKSKK